MNRKIAIVSGGGAVVNRIIENAAKAGTTIEGVEAVHIARIHAQRQSAIADLKAQLQPMPVEVRKVGANRNLPCPCGSGRKFKKCCFFLDKPIHITP